MSFYRPLPQVMLWDWSAQELNNCTQCLHRNSEGHPQRGENVCLFLHQPIENGHFQVKFPAVYLGFGMLYKRLNRWSMKQPSKYIQMPCAKYVRSSGVQISTKHSKETSFLEHFITAQLSFRVKVAFLLFWSKPRSQYILCGQADNFNGLSMGF